MCVEDSAVSWYYMFFFFNGTATTEIYTILFVGSVRCVKRQAVCVVSEVRPTGVRVFRMMALAVDGKMRGQGLATGAIARMQAYLLLEAGPKFEMRADMAKCMTKDGAGFYASQGWTGGEGVWSWRSEATEVEGALRLLASGEALEQMLQVCEQDMSVIDEAMSDLREVVQMTSKRKRGEELAHQHVRHSL